MEFSNICEKQNKISALENNHISIIFIRIFIIGIDTMERLKIDIIEAALDEFNEKGIKFTMDSIAKRLGISKKTIYTVFKDKHDLMEQTVEYGFAAIKESEQKLYQDNSIELTEKIKKILIVMPDRFRTIDFTKVYTLRENYEDIFNKIIEHVNTGWDITIELMNEAVDKGVYRPFNIEVFKGLFEAGIMKFLGDDILSKTGTAYGEALKDMVDIMINGIV